MGSSLVAKEMMLAPGEVAIHLCLMASAHPLETLLGQHLMLVMGAPGEVAIHLCPMASAHPQETLIVSTLARSNVSYFLVSCYLNWML